MALSTHHANKMYTPPPGLKFDNYGDPHFMNQCPKDFDDERIACNCKARGTPPRNRRGSGDGGNGGRGQGGGGGRVRNYRQEIFVHQPRTRRCVLSMERHTTHARNVYGTVATVPYSRRPRAIQHEWIFSHICIEEGGVNSLAAKMMERCFIIEKEDSKPDNAVFAGILGGFLQSLIK